MIIDVDLENINKYESSFLSSDELKNNPFGKYLIYYTDNQVVSYLYYSLIYDRVEINQLEVLKKYRRKNIATSLLKRLIEISNSNITLEVSENNIGAIKLYEKNGFKKVAIRKNYYKGIDAILMEFVS